MKPWTLVLFILPFIGGCFAWRAPGPPAAEYLPTHPTDQVRIYFRTGEMQLVQGPVVRNDSVLGYLADSLPADRQLRPFARSLVDVDSITVRKFDNRKSFAALYAPALAAIWVVILVRF